AGFCLTTAAWQQYVQAIDAGALIDDLAQIPAADVDTRAQRAAQLRARIEAGPVPSHIAAELLSAWQRVLGAGPCAVASSATIEDRPEASCAGQHETVLNVRERDALLRALRTCWASLFSDRALAYRAHNRPADARVGMAVLVQRLVAADAAGVLFTANPPAAPPHQ